MKKANANAGASESRRLRRANAWCLVLLAIGSLQMVGFCLGSRALRGIGASSAASPFPKVFCVAPVNAQPKVMLETFSAQFALRYKIDAEWVEVELTPEVYSRLRGPYNRRNVYGAILAYGPCLPPEMMASTLRYALVEPGPMRDELGLPASASELQVVIRAAECDGGREWRIGPDGFVEN